MRCLSKRFLIITFLVTGSFASCNSQPNKKQVIDNAPPRRDLAGMAAAAHGFLQTLRPEQRDEIQFAFDDKERLNWHYVPRSRKGVPIRDLSDIQREAAMKLLGTALSDSGFKKTTAIIKLEAILREVEGRSGDDSYRDQGKYYFSIFGSPASDTIWGWRLEGHHLSLNFGARNNSLVSATPGFFGTNPAIVLSGPEKGKYILKSETDLAFALLRSFEPARLKKAVFSDDAPSEIITGADRKAEMEKRQGILYSEMSSLQQKMFIELLSVYIHRYTKLFADVMMQEIEQAGLDQLQFAWAGDLQTGVGHPHYYRIHGPTIIIEYDNTQNNANHIHTVVRDLKNDFGGDELLEHYKRSKH